MAAFCSQLAEAEETMSALLVLTLHHIGDVLFTEPAIAALKAGHPEKPLLVVTSQEGEAVLKGHPAIDQLWVRVRTVKGFGRLLRWLRQHRATAAVSFSPSSLGLALATLLSGAKRRFGFAFRFHVSIFFTDKLPMQPQRHVVDDYLALAKAAGGKKERRIPRLFLRPEEEAWGREWLRAQGWDETTPLLGCHPFSSVASKEWGLTNFAILLQWVRKELGWLPIVFGSLGEREKAEKLAAEGKGVAAAGKLSLRQFIAVAKWCTGFIGGDSGPIHLAAALGVPTVALFGPTDPHRSGPLGNHVWVAKSPTKRMEDLSVETVRELVKAVLGGISG